MAPAAFKKEFDATIAIDTKPTGHPTTHTQTASTHTHHTETHTIFVTATVADDALPASSLSPQNPAVDSASVHGIILVSQSSPPPPTPSAETVKTTFITATRRSVYPRPSPPSFLYPEAIVPHSVHLHQPNMQHLALSGSNVIWYFSFGLEAIIGLIIVLGLVWAGLGRCVTFPPGRWIGRGKKEERRPLDKPSRYAKRSEQEDGDGTGEAMYLHETTNINAREKEGPEVRRRTRHRRHRSYGPLTHMPAPSPTLFSPCNPFLLPPNPGSRRDLKTRTSAEYFAQHATFSSSTTHPPSTYSPAASSSDSDDYAAMDTADIEALEAGKGHERKKGWVGKAEGLEKHERKKSWVVNGWVGSLARWTDEDDEGGLLPVVSRRREDGLVADRTREHWLVLPVVDRRRQVKVE
jgi:hypothetical protein